MFANPNSPSTRDFYSFFNDDTATENVLSVVYTAVGVLFSVFGKKYSR